MSTEKLEPERSVDCIRRKLSILGLDAVLEMWTVEDNADPVPVVVVNGFYAGSYAEIRDLADAACAEEFSIGEPWPLLDIRAVTLADAESIGASSLIEMISGSLLSTVGTLQTVPAYSDQSAVRASSFTYAAWDQSTPAEVRAAA